MSRPIHYIMAICAGLAFLRCNPADSPARAEAVVPESPAAPSAVITQPTDAVQAAADIYTTESTPAFPANTLDQLKSQLKEIASERVPSQPVVPQQAEAVPESIPPDEVQQLRQEVEDLHREVERLQETVDAALAYLVGELGDENRRLKKDLATRDDLEQGPSDVVEAMPEPAEPVSAPAPTLDYGAAGYLSIKEWGRTPEQAKEVGPDVGSLRGMICAVPPGSTDEQLKAIGKKLRDECAGYDNINIEIFDDEAAARDYAERNVRSNQHFVMNITRHKASGQDVVVLVRDNGAREVIVE
jgi:hypothetical protein